MRVLFVTHDGASHEPLGLEYVSAALKAAGHETRACAQSSAIDEVGRWKADQVAFQVISGDERRWGAVAAAVKAFHPHVRTVFGGPHYLFFAKAKEEHADVIVRGEAEHVVANAVEGLSFPNLTLHELDDLPHPDRELLYNHRFPGIRDNVIRNFIAARGCPYKCTYCYNSNEEWQKMVGAVDGRVRYHSPEWIVEDIERTFRDHGGRLVSFVDDIFGIKMDWLEGFVRAYQRVKIPFFAQLRPKLITRERVKMLKAAGIHIASFAIESGNEQTRAEILDRRESNELIEEGARLLREHGIKFRMQNMLGLPVEDPLADALETLRFNIKCQPTLSWCSLLQPYPGTAIADALVRKGVVKSLEELSVLVNATFFDECSVPGLKNKKEIERLHKYWSAVVRWPWLYPLVTKVAIHLDLGKRFQNWVFDKAKNYINAREYWRVQLGEHVSRINPKQPLDRLGGELVRA